MRAEPIIFTPALLERAAKAPRYSGPRLFQWATLPEEQGGNNLRAQIERAASLVPKMKRLNVLGPLLAKVPDDDQVRARVGVLLLAKTLADHGWSIEFEPEIEGGQTPDLRIAKDARTYLVEVRRIAAPQLEQDNKSIARLRDALDDVTTDTPLWIKTASIGGQASLRGFRRHVERLFEGPRPKGRQVFQDEGVLVVFEVRPPAGYTTCAVASWSNGFSFGGQHAEIRTALDEKLTRYKQPLIIALDFFSTDISDRLRDAEEVILGTEVMRFEVPLDGSPAGEPTPGRAADSILLRADATGDRARVRLQAFLPFGLRFQHHAAFQLMARILTNPAAGRPLSLAEFAPIPRLVATDNDRGRFVAYRGVDERLLSTEEIRSWGHEP